MSVSSTLPKSTPKSAEAIKTAELEEVVQSPAPRTPQVNASATESISEAVNKSTVKSSAPDDGSYEGVTKPKKKQDHTFNPAPPPQSTSEPHLSDHDNALFVPEPFDFSALVETGRKTGSDVQLVDPETFMSELTNISKFLKLVLGQ